MSHKIITLDVREDLRRGREPFSKVMLAVAQLTPDQKLRFLAPFEPTPLYAVLSGQGFDHVSKQIADGDWEILFTRRSEESTVFAPPTDPPCRAAKAKTQPPEIIDMDARGLEPPQPMVTIFEALANLPAGAELHARTDRKPMHLLAQLEERGFTGETKEQKDGSYLTKIRGH